MADPVEIYIGGSKLEGWTSMSLSRSKDELTGTLNVDMFFTYMPSEPVNVDVGRGQEILVYVGSAIAFTGIIDKRTGKGSHTSDNEAEEEPESSRSVNIGPNEYRVSFSARGKTKYLVDSSHDIRENMLRTDTQQVTQKLLEPWGVEVEWMAEAQKLDKVRFRDGARVIDELNRVMLENSHFMYETRDGRLRVTDDTAQVTGDDLILGLNIRTFSAEQSEANAKKKVKVKGQLITKEEWGEKAVIPTVLEVEADDLKANIPVVVQHYGNGDPKSLERRAKYELNKRSSRSKTVTIEVMDLEPTSGVPWDIGNLHYVEVPPEGVFDVMECTALSIQVDPEDISVSLTLSPPPNNADSGAGASSPLANLPQEVSDIASIGTTRKASSGISFTEAYPSPWTTPSFSVNQVPLIGAVVAAAGNILSSLTKQNDKPPERIP